MEIFHPEERVVLSAGGQAAGDTLRSGETEATEYNGGGRAVAVGTDRGA